jgi:hypothetical protein
MYQVTPLVKQNFFSFYSNAQIFPEKLFHDCHIHKKFFNDFER